MSSVLTPRPCRTPYSSSPKSSPTGPTTRTSVKNDAASEKWTADPPSMRSRCPNSVCTASKAIEPTTTRLMRPRRLAEGDAAAGDRRRLHDRGGRLPENDEVVDDLFEVCHVAHVRLHEVTVVAGYSMALDHLRGLPCKLGDIRQLPRRWPHADHRRQCQTEGAWVDVRLVGADDTVGLESLQALGDSRRREPDTAAEFRDRHPRVILELGENTVIRLIQRRITRSPRYFPLNRRHEAETSED